MVSGGGRFLNASEMGLGKGRMSIATAARLGLPWIVICPAGLKFNWKQEIETTLPELSKEICVLRGSASPLSGSIIIASYDIAAKLAHKLWSLKPKVVILDESVAIKNPEIARTKAIVPLCRWAPHTLLVSGRPIMSRPMELWSQLKAIDLPGLPSHFDFGRRFCAGHQQRIWVPGGRQRVVWNFDGASNLDELHELIKPRLILYKKKDVLPQLPEKRRVRMMLDCTDPTDKDLRTTVRAALKENRGDVERAFAQLKRSLLGGEIDDFNKAYREIGPLKAAIAAPWIVENVTPDSPLVVFLNHRTTLEVITKVLDLTEIRYGVIRGSVPPEQRQRLVNRFQDGELDLLLNGIRSANYGLTMTRASEELLVELPWTPAEAEQCEDRIHRIGTTRGVTCRYCVSNSLIDRAMWAMLNRKSRYGEQILSGRDAASFFADESDESGMWSVVREVLQEVADGN